MNRRERRERWVAAHRNRLQHDSTNPAPTQSMPAHSVPVSAGDHLPSDINRATIRQLTIERVVLIDMDPVSHSRLGQLLSLELSSSLAAITKWSELQNTQIPQYFTTNSTLSSRSSADQIARAISQAVQSTAASTCNVPARQRQPS